MSAQDRAAMDLRFSKFIKTRAGSTRSPFSAESEAAKRSATDSTNSQRVALA
jgi:hypothetical protein